jgi:MOSC domain-containing protein YiiM
LDQTTTRIRGLFAGGITLIGAEQQRTGIVKRRRDRVTVTPEGIAGDVQADRRFHGGPDKAIHHYAAESYERLATRFPAMAPLLFAGTLGENLSTRGWTEDEVAIGDVYGAGDVALQVTQPRRPCWKINDRLGEPGASRWIADQGITGWYCRTLAGGELALGDELVRSARSKVVVTVREFWRIVQGHRPAPEDLERVAGTPGLAVEWRQRLEERLAWLGRNPDQQLK